MDDPPVRVVISKLAHAAYRAETEAGDAVAAIRNVLLSRIVRHYKPGACHASH